MNRLFLFVATAVGVILSLMPANLCAQSYEKLWKQVQQAEENGLPKTVIKLTEQIQSKALKEGKAGQLFKATVCRNQNRQRLTPDSVYAHLAEMEQWAATEQDEVNRALLHTLLADFYSRYAQSNSYALKSRTNLVLDDEEAFPQDIREWTLRQFVIRTDQHAQAAIANPTLLATTPNKTLIPMVTQQKMNASQFYGHDLLHLLSRYVFTSYERFFSFDETEKGLAEERIDSLYNKTLIPTYQSMADKKDALILSQLGYQGWKITRAESDRTPAADTEAFLQREASLSFFDKMIALYGEREVCAEIYIQKAQILSRQYQRQAELLKTCDEGISRYPKYPRINLLKEIRSRVLQPDFRLTFKPAVYPGDSIALNVTYRQFKGFTVKVYRANPPQLYQLLPYYDSEKLETYPRQSLLMSQHFDVKPIRPENKENISDEEVEFLTNQTTLKLPAIKELGTYLVEVIPDTRATEKKQTRFLSVTRLKALSLDLPDGQTELLTLDSKTGHPVPGVKLDLYRRIDSDKQEKITTVTTGEDGKVLVKTDRKVNYLVAAKDDDRAFPPVHINMYTFNRSTPQEEVEMQLLTDRALYRPGQQVHVKGIAYTKGERKAQVAEGKTYEVVLYNANYKEMSRHKVKTNDFGSFATTFTLPTACLNGRFTISVDRLASTAIRVEEYKRPSFEITFDPITAAYRLGDTIRLCGQVKSFNGASVQEMPLAFTINENTTAYRWRKEKKALVSDTVRLDAEGRFTIPVTLKSSDQQSINNNKLLPNYLKQRSYGFIVEAQVTNEAGETQHESRWIRAENRRFSAYLTRAESYVLSDLINRDELLCKPIIHVINSDNVNLQISGTYRLYNGQGTVAKEATFQPGKPIDTNAWKQLPTGKYRMDITLRDSLGREETDKDFFNFTLYAPSEKRMPVFTSLYAEQLNKEVDSMTPARIRLATSYSDAYVLMNIFKAGARIESRVLNLDDEITTVEIPYKETYGDEISVNFLLVKDNKSNMKQLTFSHRQPSRQLNLKWEVMRDKLRPGQQEEWRLTIKDSNGPAAAEMLAMMYDASLDQIAPFYQDFRTIFHSYLPSYIWTPLYRTDRNIGFYFRMPSYSYSSLTYDGLYDPTPYVEELRLLEDGIVAPTMQTLTRDKTKMFAAKANNFDVGGISDTNTEETSTIFECIETVDDMNTQALRSNFNETAFFYPQLRTNEAGELVISFTMPESLTRWNFRGYAHTRDMKTGSLTAETVTQKDFMLMPNLPRYVRTGDLTTFSATVTNLTDATVKGNVIMEIFDPMTDKIIHREKERFNAEARRNQAVSFTWQADDRYDLVGIRLRADGGRFSDGEQHLLPVLSDKQQVTETLTLPIRGHETKSFDLSELFNHQAESATHRRLTIEMTGNPAWMAVQALPNLSLPVNDNAISWAISLYANSLAAYVAQSQPRIRTMINAWKARGGNKEAFLSQQEKNQELKNILLSESPWVMEAESETEQRNRLATLFDVNEMSNRESSALAKLRQLQDSEGGWSWFPGMRPSVYMTGYIAQLLTRLEALQTSNAKVTVSNAQEETDSEQSALLSKAMDFLGKELTKEYKECLKAEKKGVKITEPTSLAFDYLYLVALSGKPADKQFSKAYNYFLAKVPALIHRNSIGTKSRAAVILRQAGKTAAAEKFIASVREHLTTTDEMGAHFAFNETVYGWGMRPVQEHVAAMEALAADLDEKKNPDEMKILDEMKIWLIKQKQVTMWENPVTTADAVHALICPGNDLLSSRGEVTIKLGKRQISTLDQSATDGLAYIKQTFSGQAPELKQRTLTVSKADDGIAFGAVYAQYLSPIADLQTTAGKELQVEKTLYVERLDAKGRKSLEAVKEGTLLRVGDKVVSRMVIRLDRAMDFVQLKDARGACFEPLSQLSGYRWGQGIGYYIEIEDAATNFFFDHLGKGIYVLEHPYRIAREGRYQAGIATLQCAYAPEMAGHSAGMMIEVK